MDLRSKDTRVCPLTAATGSLAGCASVQSTRNPSTDRGLVHYMPKRDLLITVTAASGKLTAVTATASTAYADRTTPYLLEYQSHPIAKNTLDIEVSEGGS